MIGEYVYLLEMYRNEQGLRIAETEKYDRRLYEHAIQIGKLEAELAGMSDPRFDRNDFAVDAVEAINDRLGMVERSHTDTYAELSRIEDLNVPVDDLVPTTFHVDFIRGGHCYELRLRLVRYESGGGFYRVETM